jgi:nucleoporin GLE1
VGQYLTCFPEEQPKRREHSRTQSASAILSPSLKRSSDKAGVQEETILEHPSSPTKRSRNSLENITVPGRVLDYGADGSDNENADKIASSLPGSFDAQAKLEDGDSTKSSSPDTPQKAHSEPTSPLSAANASPFSRHMVTPQANKYMMNYTPFKSPRNFPLPASPEGNEIASDDEGDSSGNSPERHLDVNRPQPNLAAAHAAKLTEKLSILSIKAEQFSEAMAYRGPDKKYHQQIEDIYNSKDRFDPAEAARLEAIWQGKVRAVLEKEEKRQYDLWMAEQARLEAERRAKEAEAARIAEERRKREEEERRKREAEEAERRRKEQETANAKAQADKERADKEAAERAAAEQARQEQQRKENEARQQQQQQQQQQQASAAPAQAVPSTPIQAAEGPLPFSPRKELLTDAISAARVIQNLKALRKQCTPEYLKSHDINGIGREFRPKFGQLTGEKRQTIEVRNQVKTIFQRIKAAPGPTVSSHMFFLTVPNPPPADVQVPIIFIYVLNMVAKMVVKQIVQEAGSSTRSADPIGVILSSTFADPEFCVEGKSFIDIFVARLLKANPILRGELGPVEDNVPDRRRLGWRQLPSGNWETEEDYGSRIQALTSGYVAIAGRDFTRSQLKNPYPMFNLWHKLATLCNTPVDQLTTGHYYCARTLLERGAPKMVKVYGVQAAKLARIACREWAEEGIKRGYGGANAVASLGSNWEQIVKVQWYLEGL